jgi:hypothetical protein
LLIVQRTLIWRIYTIRLLARSSSFCLPDYFPTAQAVPHLGSPCWKVLSKDIQRPSPIKTKKVLIEKPRRSQSEQSAKRIPRRLIQTSTSSLTPTRYLLIIQQVIPTSHSNSRKSPVPSCPDQDTQQGPRTPSGLRYSEVLYLKHDSCRSDFQVVRYR